MAIGYTDWFTLTHTISITFTPGATGDKTHVEYHALEHYPGYGDYTGPLSEMPADLRNAVYPFDGFDHIGQAWADYHADFQRGFHIGDGSPEDPDTLDPHIPSDVPGASSCAWEWARHSRNSSQSWDGSCYSDYERTASSSTPVDPIGVTGPFQTSIRYYGHAYNPFIFQFGDVNWEWRAVILSLNFATAFGAGQQVNNSLMPATAIALEWDETVPPITFLDGGWSWDSSGDYTMRSFKRRVAFHDSGDVDDVAPGNETPFPWWPGMDGYAPPRPGTEFPPGMDFGVDDLNLLTDGAREVFEYVNSEDSDLIDERIEFAFIPERIYNDDWPGILGVTTWFEQATVDSVTFHFTYKTRPFRWSYRLPPTGGPGPIRRRWAVGKR